MKPFQRSIQAISAILASVFAVSILASCQYAAKIESPTDERHFAQAVGPFSVRFHDKFEPGSFRAVLNGTDITGQFHPAAAPGSVSTCDLTDPPVMIFIPPTADGNRQQLRVFGDFAPGFASPGLGEFIRSDSSNFYPPTVSIFRGNTQDRTISMREREVIVATAFVENAPKEGLAVKIRGHSAVSLNDQPAGQDIFVTIPPNDRRADFKVRGIVTQGEAFAILPIAKGYSSAEARGIVTRNP